MLLIILFILTIILCYYFLQMLLYPFANFSKILQKYYCKIDWHSYKRLYQEIKAKDVFDTNTHCRCPWCGFEGLIDSQGNLF